jgi:hypothetical protein
VERVVLKVLIYTAGLALDVFFSGGAAIHRLQRSPSTYEVKGKRIAVAASQLVEE